MCLRNDNFMWNAGFYSCDDSVWRIVQTWRGILFYGAGHHMLYCGVTKVETQNLASHKQKVHIYSWYYCCCNLAKGCSWDARFCVSTGWCGWGWWGYGALHKYAETVVGWWIIIHGKSARVPLKSTNGNMDANTWVLRGLCKCLTVRRMDWMWLRRELCCDAKRAFLHYGKASFVVQKSVYRHVAEPFRWRGKGFLAMLRGWNCTVTPFL